MGSGPFPTELLDDLGQKLQHDGDEFGATTGRPRRCGWFDAVVARHAVRLNGLNGLAVTKLDVLTGFKTMRVCVALRARRQAHRRGSRPAWRSLNAVRPIYEEFPGWDEPLAKARSLDDLPTNAQRYLDRARRAHRHADLHGLGRRPPAGHDHPAQRVHELKNFTAEDADDAEATQRRVPERLAQPLRPSLSPSDVSAWASRCPAPVPSAIPLRPQRPLR